MVKTSIKGCTERLNLLESLNVVAKTGAAYGDTKYHSKDLREENSAKKLINLKKLKKGAKSVSTRQQVLFL
jgi:hypothetical protein